MTTVPLSTERPEAPLFCDGLGERVVAADGATGELLQILRIRPALSAVPSFEFALRERAARLANFRHAYYARVRRIDRVQTPAPGLAIVSDHVEGTRLSDILRVAHERRLQLDINAALCLIRQLVPAVALLHENAREVAHGLIAPERLVVTPHARLVIVEHVLAAAVDQLQFSRDRLWQEFRIAMPPSAGVPRFDHRADVTGLGLVALALVLGRPLRAEEFPHGLPALLRDARERTSLGEEQPISSPLRDWLSRALQIDNRRAFASAPEALSALEEVVADDSMYVAAPVALETFLSRYIAAILEPLPSEVPAVAPMMSQPVAPRSATSPTPPPPAPLPAAPPMSPPPFASVPAPVVVPPSPPLQPTTQPIVTTDLLKPSAVTPAPPITPEFVQSIAAPLDPPRLPGTPVEPPVFNDEPIASPRPASVDPVGVRDITELISAADLAPRRDSIESIRPLFESESDDKKKPERQAKSKGTGPSKKLMVAAAAAVIVLGGGGVFASRYFRTAPPGPAMGTLDVQSNPAGVQVFVDGTERGQTPAKLSLPPGAHILELRGRGVPRVIPLTVTAGAQVSQYLEFADTPVTGQLRVQSQPAGAKVLVDGVDHGAAPVTVTDLTAGDHEVILQTPSGSVKQVVSVQAGAMASFVAPVPTEATAGPVSGWVTVKAPVAVEIREGGRLLGTSDTDRVMMAAGRHELELVNETLGYRSTRVVQVPPGKVAPISIDLPSGVVNLNASPWAEVWIDGQRVGETPIGNLSVPIGPHEVIFRNPQLGEKRHAISVTTGTPVRLSVDMK
jgi:serine/threonine protein kinase